MTPLYGFVGSLNGVATQGTHTVQVPPATAQLRVALNAVDDGVSDFNIYVRFGSPPTTSVFDCKADGPNQYGFCQLTNPAAGTWHILVDRYAGAGYYQVTATTFGSDCSDPANEGQPCDDGNSCTFGDTCQSGACGGSVLPDDSPCDDGNPCTRPDTCQAGTCSGTEKPRTDCIDPFIPERGLVRLQKRPGKPQKLTWNWTNGSLTSKNDFGAPTGNTNYDVCIYDQRAGVDQLTYSKRIAAAATCNGDPCWREFTTGYKYRDPRATNGNITMLLLKEGVDGRARITVKGQGDGLALPALPLSQVSTVTMQLSNGLTCWQARFSSNSRNDPTEFKAKPD